MKKLLVLVLATTLIFALAACGKKEEKAASASTGSSNDIKIEASNWKFDKAEYKVKKGEPVKLSLVNKAGVHSLEIKDLGIQLAGGKSTAFTPDKAGTYEIICSTPCGSSDQHSNMKANLIVE